MTFINLSVLRTQLKGLRPGRLLATGLSVLVASFMVFGAVLAYQIVTRTALDTFSDTPQGTSLVISSDGAGVSADQLTAIRRTPGVAQAVGRLTATLAVGDRLSGTSLDVIADPGAGPLSGVTLLSGSYPDTARELALDRQTADRLGATVGSTLSLRRDLGTGRDVVTKVTVTGLATGPGKGERGFAPDSVVSGLGGGQDRWSRVDILAAPGTQPTTLMDRLSALLSGTPDGYASITTGDTARLKEAKEEASRFDQIFAVAAMFVAVAVVAAVLVVSSTFRVVFAQRLRQLALLRTVGAQRGQLVRALATEGTVVGLLTGALGVLLAGAAGLAAPAVAGAAGQRLSGPGLPLGAAIATVVGAALLTTGAGLVPALSAAGVAPLEALRSAGTNAAERGIGAGRLLVGLLLAAASAAVAWLTATGLPEPGQPPADTGTVLLKLVAAGGFAFTALLTLGPLLVRPVLAVVGWPLRRLGPTGGLAVGVVGGAPRRAAAVSGVVALGVALVAGAIVGTASLRGFATQTMAVRAPADLVMFAGDKPITADLLGRLRADGGYRHVTPFRMVEFADGDLSYAAVDLDMAALPRLDGMEPASGSFAGLGPGRAVVAATLAQDRGVDTGDELTLRSEHGQVRVTVAAVLPGEAPLRTSAVLSPGDLDRLAGLAGARTAVLADLAGSGGARDRALAGFRRVGAGNSAEVAVLADERAELDGEISSLFAVALGLLGLTVLVAVVGVGTTTGLSVLERIRECGLLRALGLSRRRLRLMVGIESSLYGVIGAVFGLVIGVPFAWLAVTALDLGGSPRVPGGQLLLIILALAGIAGLAGLLPAQRAARVSPIVALAAPD